MEEEKNVDAGGQLPVSTKSCNGYGDVVSHILQVFICRFSSSWRHGALCCSHESLVGLSSGASCTSSCLWLQKQQAFTLAH